VIPARNLVIPARNLVIPARNRNENFSKLIILVLLTRTVVKIIVIVNLLAKVLAVR